MSRALDYSATSPELHKLFDADDPFMTKGYAITKKRHGQRRETPIWVKDQKQVQALLLRSFPKLKVDRRQRDRAARWARVIHLYFNLLLPFGEVQAEMNVSRYTLLSLLRAIRRVSNNRRADGSKNLGGKPGRPWPKK